MSKEISKDWAIDYCHRLMAKNNLVFPLELGRKKIGGYVDSLKTIRNEEDFFEAYKSFDEHPRCSAILLYNKALDKPLSI